MLKIAVTIAVLGSTIYTSQAQQKFGDNLGTHIASKALDMNTQQILNASGVAIGTATLSNNSIALQIDGSDKAILIPRVATNGAILAPQNGMIIYNTTDNKFSLYQNGAWVNFALSLVASSTGINTTGNTNGYTLTQVGQEMVLKLSPATATEPGVVTVDAQSFAGNKTFGGNLIVTGTTTLNGNTTISGTNTLTVGTGAATLGGKVTATGLTAAVDDATEAALVVDKTTGEIKKSAFSPVAMAQLKLTIPTVVLGTNTANTIVISSIANVKKNDGVIINYDADDLAANPTLAYISLLNATASADGTVTVTVADMRQYDGTTALSDAGALLTGKHFTLTYYHKK